MNQLTVSFHVQQAPRCPICRDKLLSRCFHIWSGVAFCLQCLKTIADPVLVGCINASRDARLAHYWSEDCGVVFFTPEGKAWSSMPAHLLIAAEEAHRDRAELTPDAERFLSELERADAAG